MKTSLLVLASAALLACAASASAQTVINSVPFTISVSGKYILGNNLATSSFTQTAITISAPNVVLDLNQFFVSGPGLSTTTTTPVISVANVSNVIIRNGTVANNGYGIFFSGTTPNSINHLVENVNITRCKIAGVYFSGSTSGSVVRANAISQTGGGVSESAPRSAYGIFSTGGLRIEDNTITDVKSPAAAIISGIDASAGDFVVGNTISQSGGNGIRFGKCLNNLTDACPTPFNTITNGGGNN